MFKKNCGGPQLRVAIIQTGRVTGTAVKNRDVGVTAEQAARDYSNWSGGQTACVWMDPRVRVRPGQTLTAITPRPDAVHSPPQAPVGPPSAYGLTA